VEYRKEVDGLRALAVVSVILFHARIPGFTGGYVGVDVFFVISGYLITSLLLGEFQATGKVSYTNFVLRRVRRILPALLLVIVVTSVVSWYFMTPYQLRDYSQSLIATLLFGSNILFWFESGYFSPSSELKPLLHTWSLAIEEQFYIFFPALFAFVIRVKFESLRYICWLLLLVCLAMSVMNSQEYPEAAFFLTPMRAWCILFGVLLAIELNKRNLPGSRSHAEFLSLIGIALVFVGVFLFDEFTVYPGSAALVPVVGAVLVLAYAKQETFVGRCLGYAPIVWVGLLSYSLYLWHQPVLVFYRMQEMTHLNWFSTCCALVLTCVCAYVSFKLVENPVRNKEKVGNRQLVTSVTVTTTILLLAGVVALINRGEIGRYDETALDRMDALRLANIERQHAIRYDVCHYNNLTGIGLENFIANWDCVENDENKKRILIAGDSHSADLAVALRQNDIAVTQLGGAGCSLDPSNMTNDCKTMFEAILPDLRKTDFDLLILANRYEGNELSAEVAQRVLDYWGAIAEKTAVFTGAVEKLGFDRAIVLNKEVSSVDYLPRYSEDEFFSYLSAKDVMVVDRKAIYCSLTTRCTIKDSRGNLLMVDPDHLSVYGAGLFGRVAVQHLGL
jgi:peptidoglycan/LPS O-acetylase OafA/YrhL